MTASEFREEFNLRYNNALEGAPGLDTFEISTYLTIAQEQYVKINYDVTKDPSSAFELVERSRRILNELVENERITNFVSSSRGLVDESRFAELSNDAMYIVLETLMLKNGDYIRVVPTTHDEFMVSYKNPFRKPNKRKAWRLDISKENSKTTVEIVSSEDIALYNVRYLSYPSPIIVGDLTTSPDVAGLELSIEGQTSQTTCKLANIPHRDIINIAVENAVLDYRNGTLEARVKLDSRV